MENEQAVEETTEEQTTDETVENNDGDSQTDWKAKAEKAQAELAKHKAIKDRKKKKTKVSNELPNRDDIRIMAKMSDEEIDQLEVISNGQGISLKEASENPMFKSWKESEDAKAKSEKAQLGTSSGSKGKDAPDISNMTEKEHEEYSRKLLQS